MLAAAALAGAATIAGCSNPYSGELLVADAPGPESTADIRVWSVEPGDELSDDNLAIDNAYGPLAIDTVTADGETWTNGLGRTWQGGNLLAYDLAGEAVVSAGTPGEVADELARSASARTTVLRRGTYVQTAEGCVLATSATAVDEVGAGSCAISQDERWVASWSTTGEGLTIRDLRNDSTETVDGLAVARAAVLAKDARVLAVVVGESGYEAVLIDATDGSEIARSEPYPALDVSTPDPEAEGFVLSAGAEAGNTLLYMDTDGELVTVDQGTLVEPVLNSHEVTYLFYDTTFSTSSLRRWSPDHEPEVLLEGFVGAGAVDGSRVIATRETPEGTEFYREEAGTGEMHQVLTLPRAADDADPNDGEALGASVSRMLVHGSTVMLQVDGATTSSFVRIDLSGDHSDVPVEHAAGLRLASIDVDGTALLTRQEGDPAAGAVSTDVMIVRLHDHDPDVRATVGSTSTNLIHEGRIYVTDTSDPEDVRIVSMRSTGKLDREVLYSGKQIGGATWPQNGGATTSQLTTPALLVQRAQQQQQAQQAAQQQAGGVGSAPAGGAPAG